MEGGDSDDTDYDISLVDLLKRSSKKRKPQPRTARPDNPEPTQVPFSPDTDDHPSADAPPQITVSEFDYSVDNHFKAVDTITKVCRHPETLNIDQAEIQRFSHSITFLREWRDFKYASRVVKFACQHNSMEKDVIGEITLPQFSSASVPKRETQNGSTIPGTEYSKYFIMNVGGAVWALDWCHSDDRNSENYIKSEFLAVAAHPPESSYHKIGAPLTGRGAIQIWCLLTICTKEDAPPQGNKKPTRNPQKREAVNSNEPTQPPKLRGRLRKTLKNDSVENVDNDSAPRPRGRPRKTPKNDHVENIDTDSISMQPLAVIYPECSSTFVNSSDKSDKNIGGHVSEDSGRTCKDSNQTAYADVLLLTGPEGRENKTKGLKTNQNKSKEPKISRSKFKGLKRHQVQSNGESSDLNPFTSEICSLDSVMLDKNTTCISSRDAKTFNKCIPADVALPRMMLCLTHNGKVAWDVKWQPFNPYDPGSVNKMGYLAVLLGNGALEVWEVPLPRTMKHVYPASEEHIDPRFIKLQPIFRCSKLNWGDRQSIPLTVEWSASPPHDMILAGCHDGVVALWKFSITDSSTDTRPLLSFCADTGPVRTLAWAPIQSNQDGAHVIVTAGQKGFKFWDIRDPFCPLWEHPVQGINYSVDWLPEPRCVIGCLDDGTLWFQSLSKLANDVPIIGKPTGLKQGIHNFDCSSFTLWSVQASKLTGMVAYCGEEGTTQCFQLTARTANDTRHRLVHHLIGSVVEENSVIVLVTPSRDSQFSKNTRVMKRGSKETEAFPEKIVALHKVRWNVNKGSEKWLCYGGAAGLVRCEDLDLSVFQ